MTQQHISSGHASRACVPLVILRHAAFREVTSHKIVSSKSDSKAEDSTQRTVRVRAIRFPRQVNWTVEYQGKAGSSLLRLPCRGS